MTWLDLDLDERKSILTTLASSKGINENAVEKDWWVSMILEALFSLPVSESLVFKGGTSLSKGWNLINRFSEDIDLAIDRSFFGFGKELSKNQRDKLRKTSKKFIDETLSEALSNKLVDFGLEGHFKMVVPETKESDIDPVVLYVEYESILDPNPYIAEKVKLEISCRSMREPFEAIMMRSMMAEAFSDEPFADKAVSVQTVLPGRTFLEKAFLLHEEFNRVGGCSRLERLTRHMYDLEKMMDQPFAIEAMSNQKLYAEIVEHRSKFTAWKGFDYKTNHPSTISFLPPKQIEEELRNDYSNMQQHFIYGSSLSFDDLMKRLEILQQRFRAIENDAEFFSK